MQLSIIVPVYNVKDYLVQCLQSIEHQILDDFEVIVVDDGSTDESGKIVDNFCCGKKRFRVFHKENGGLMSAWIFGVKQSIGNYIGFVDSDDYVSEDMFSKMLCKAFEYRADIVMCDRYDVIDGKTIGPCYDKNGLGEGFYGEDRIRQIKDMVFPMPGTQELTKARWNKIFKRELFLPNMKYCECLSKTFEDRYITPPCVFSATSFYYLKEPLYYYVHRRGSNSGMYKPDLLDQIKRMYYTQESVLKDKNLMIQFQENWEYVFIDYIRQYITRNMINVSDFKSRMLSASTLLGDELVRERIKRYGHLDKSNMGKALRLAYTLHSPLILTIASYF